VTPDSFSDGGAVHDDPAAAASAGVTMAEAGAALIDVGGESTRPGAATVWEGDEIARVVPVIERLARSGTLVSIDTRKAGVMEAALGAGAAIVNDVAALLWDDRALEVVAKAGCPV
ncbi:dihydropteroate synthase, partial [Pseudomonas sp. GW531-E2]